MPGREFHCEDPDFTVHSTPDGELFRVRRERLVLCEVFRDMFACCEAGYVIDTVDEDDKIMHIQESAAQLNILFEFLHHPPKPFVPPTTPKPKDFTRIVENIPEHTIPFPLLLPLFRLADKYVFPPDLMQILSSHLGAYVSTFPLRVYGFATELGLNEVAAEASMHLLYPPLTSYTPEEMRAIPTAEAYHKLLLLHDFRVKKLGEILMEADIFPHGYGECSRHSNRTCLLWENRRHVVLGKIQAATDVAAEMVEISPGIGDCQNCGRAFTAAVAMLAYKCGKVPRRIDQIPV